MTVAQGISPAMGARLRSRPFFLVPLIALATLAVTIHYGSFVAGGSDSQGYLSQARLWTQGWPIVHEPLITQTTALGSWTFIPIAYRPGRDFGTFVPITSIGYPLMMAAVVRLFGSGSEMYVVPFAAAALVFFTGWIGRRIGGDVAGVLSSLLLATSPIFLFQSLQPMSDVPAACLWLLAAASVMARRRWVQAAVVPAVALAIMTRPNLVPLALPLAIFAAFVRRGETRPYDWTAAVLVAAGFALGATAVAYSNSVLFGAPQSTGYGRLGNLYGTEYLLPNLQRYARWVFDTETYLIPLAAVGLIRLALAGGIQRMWVWFTAAIVSVVCVSYFFYTAFDNWTYLRFLLPAFPLVFIAYACVVQRPVLAALLTLPILAGHVSFIATHGVLQTAVAEQRYIEVADYVSKSLPENSLLISAQHSGSIRYYTSRKTLRFDWLEARNLDNALRQTTALGYRPYILLDDWEEAWFKSRFRRNPISRLDWPPLAEFNRARIYDLAARK